MPNAAGIAYIDAGRVLLLKRAASSVNGGTWGFPAGGIEPGETPEQAAIRESFEEVGHIPKLPLQFVNDDGSFVTYKISGERFTPKLNSEHTAHEWADLRNLPSPLHPGIMEILEGFRVDSKRIPDINGFIEIQDNPISKVGVFPYSGRAVGDLENPDKIYRVYRPEEELSNPETIKSFQLLPFVNDHPATLLGSEAIDASPVDKKPADGVIGEKVYFADGYLRGNLKFFTDRIASAIDAGKREVSAGFRCMYEKAVGSFNGQPYDYIQRNIRGNHVALVDQGRAGPDVAVLDHMILTYDAKELFKMADPEKTEPAEPGAAKDEMTLAEITSTLKAIGPQVAALTQAMAALVPGAAPTEPAVVEDANPDPAVAPVADADPTAMDAIDKRVKAAIDAELKKMGISGKAMDAKELFIAANARDTLYKGVSAVVGAFDHSAMDAHDVAVYAVDKLGIKGVPSGSEIIAVNAYLAAKPGKMAVAQDSHNSGTVSPIRKHVGA